MYSWVGWRCHNPLAAKGERDRSLGQRGEEYMRQLLCSTNAGEWAWTCNVTAVNIVFWGSLLFWRKRENCIHAPPWSGFQVKEKNGWTPKMNPLPPRKLIYGGPLMKPESLWSEDAPSCMFHTVGTTDIVERWKMCEQMSKDAILHHYLETCHSFSQMPQWTVHSCNTVLHSKGGTPWYQVNRICGRAPWENHPSL